MVPKDPQEVIVARDGYIQEFINLGITPEEIISSELGQAVQDCFRKLGAESPDFWRGMFTMLDFQYTNAVDWKMDPDFKSVIDMIALVAAKHWSDADYQFQKMLEGF